MFIFLSSVILVTVVSHFALFFLSFFFSDHTTRLFSCLVILYRKQACWTDLTWFVWVRIGRFCIEDFDLVANLCICKCSLFCILQRVSKHCVAMLILLNLHWQAALMVFFYVFVWLFLVSMATDCTWWQATGHYDVNLGLVSLSYFFLLLCTDSDVIVDSVLQICNVMRVLQKDKECNGK